MYNEKRLVPPFDVDSTSVDWRTIGVVRKIKDQANCGACWSFTTIANSESAYAIKTGKLYDFSEQHLIDCNTLTNDGCNGGWMSQAAEYL